MSNQRRYMQHYARYILLVLTLCSQCDCGCTDLKHCFKTSKPGRINGTTVKIRNGTGYRDCYNDCVQHSPHCNSFNYNKFTGYCELTDVVPSLTNIVEDNDFIYSLIPSSELITDACTIQACPLVNSKVCIPLSTGSGTCIQECELLPQPTHGQTEYTSMFFVAGTEVPLACDAGYRMVGTGMTCLTSGSWMESFCVPNVCTFETSCNALETDSTASSIFEMDSGSTTSDDTGCTKDHTTGTGNYYYFEASSPIQPGNTARMKTSFPVPAGHQVCVHLWYHMWGHSMGSLQLKTKNSAGMFTSTQLIASGDQGTNWLEKTLTFSAQSQVFWIVIEGIRGSDTKSDICIDDVEIYNC